jgi:hypothetical protein
LPNGLKNGLNLFIVPCDAALQFFELSGQGLVRGQEPPQVDEGAHDLNIDQHGPRTAQDGRQHGDALFGEGLRQVLAVSPSANV